MDLEVLIFYHGTRQDGLSGQKGHLTVLDWGGGGLGGGGHAQSFTTVGDVQFWE